MLAALFIVLGIITGMLYHGFTKTMTAIDDLSEKMERNQVNMLDVLVNEIHKNKGG